VYIKTLRPWGVIIILLSPELRVSYLRQCGKHFIMNHLFTSWKTLFIITVECRSRPDLNSKLIERKGTNGWTIKLLSSFNFTNTLNILSFLLFFYYILLRSDLLGTGKSASFFQYTHMRRENFVNCIVTSSDVISLLS